MKKSNYLLTLVVLLFGTLARAQVYEVNLASIVELSVNLDENCQVEILPSMVLTGDFDVDGDGFIPPDDLFMITIMDSDLSNGNILDGCGRWEYNVMWDPSVIGPDDLSGFLTGTDVTSAAFVNVPGPASGLFITQYGGITVETLPGSVPRCYTVDGNSGAVINNSMAPALQNRLLQGGGLPLIFDACSEVEICVQDQILSGNDCGNLVVRRTFTAQDENDACADGEPLNASVSEYIDLVFQRPTLSEVQAPPSLVTYDCDDWDMSSPLPEPQASDYPFISTIGGPTSLINPFGSLSVGYVDGSQVVICDDAYQFVRTYQVIDECSDDNVMTYTQLVQVGDFSAPMLIAPTQDLDFDGQADEGPLTFTTNNSADCGAFILPLGGVTATDECSGMAELFAFIFPEGDMGVAPLGPYQESDFSDQIPPGLHIIRYIAMDNCGNSDTLDVDMRVLDQSEPVAVCEDGLVVSLGGNGEAVLMPEDIDRASYDDCGDYMGEVAFADEDGNIIGPFGPEVVLDCSDIPSAYVALRVTDDGNRDGLFQFGIDNSNTCVTMISVSDEIAPVCVAPANVLINCTEVDDNIPQDLNAAFNADPFGTSALMDQVFGEANGFDNCGIMASGQSLFDNRNSCGAGTIIRTFNYTDEAGFTSQNNCQQLITITELHDYSITFPADASSPSCLDPDYNGLTYEAFGCDLITVNTTVDTFQATALECYKLRLTYEVINWCEYDTESDAYRVPRDADNDDVLEEPTTLHITPGELTEFLEDDIAFLDNDNNRNNGYISPLDDSDPFGQVEGADDELGYGMDASRGAFRYRQFVKVYDEQAPNIDIGTLSSSGLDQDGDCLEDYQFSFVVQDNCTSHGITSTVELDVFATDNDGDGVYTLADFMGVPVDDYSNEEGEMLLTSHSFDTEINATIRDLPIGRHAVRIRATDGCGNSTLELLIFEILDTSAPTPVCINGLTVTLAPDGNGGGFGSIDAETFSVDALQDCSGGVQLAIYRTEDANGANFTPSASDTRLNLDCEDLGFISVRIYTIDPLGNFSYCETSLLVQAFQETACSDGETFTGDVQGSVATYANEAVEGVMIGVSGDQMDEQIYTDEEGGFMATDLTVGNDYTLDPSLDANVDLSRVTTSDIIILMQHLLGVQEMTSPYQHVAADVTGDGQLNVHDIVAMRRVILGMEEGFPNAPTWRFVDINHDFGGNPGMWASSSFPEVVNLNNFDANTAGADFIAIAMGDISGNALDANMHDNIAEARSTAQLTCEDLEMRQGNSYELSIYTDDALAGFQGTIELDAEVELLEVEGVALSNAKINQSWLERGLISFSENEPIAAGTELFRLHLRALSDVRLSDKLRISDIITPSEAYPAPGELANLRLGFLQPQTGTVRSGFQLDQNFPNPMQERTSIGFTIPEAGPVELAVYDQIGRTLLLRTVRAQAGYNQTDIQIHELGDASGNLTYTVRYADQFVSRKMIVLR
ncbi:MAG: hypothetical protein AAF433_07435 [Bacteroidota bacterium]